MERTPYDHAEWTIPQLDERVRTLTHFILSMPHGQGRRAQLEHERACLEFELDKQIAEAMENGTTAHTS